MDSYSREIKKKKSAYILLIKLYKLQSEFKNKLNWISSSFIFNYKYFKF